MSTPQTLPQAVCARARKARDPRFDGLFFVAVVSTGIYCRPICPAPLAKESNVRYFAHAAPAAAAGYRPCLRCRPELAPGLAPCDSTERSFELAWQRVREGALGEGSLADLAAEIGLSERQLRRQFVERLGVAPHAVHATQRLLLAKQLLSETGLPVTDIAYASGFRSLRRFNQAFLEQCGMPPSRLRERRRSAEQELLELKLGYRPPYDFAGVLRFLALRAVSGIERVDDQCYWRVFGSAQAPGWLRVDQIPDQNALRLRLRCPDLAMLPELIRRLRRLFDLDAQPETIAEALGLDPQLAASVAAQPGRRVPGAFAGFETAVRAVLGQQVSVAAARTLCTRLVEAWGPRVCLPDLPDLRLFPEPAVLAEANVRSIGLTASRAATVRALARAVAECSLDLERIQPLPAWHERICALPGIGPWTAEYIAMRCLHHPDAFPAGDLVVRKQLGQGQPISTKAASVRAENWRPWRAYAVMHLWHLSSETTY